MTSQPDRPNSPLPDEVCEEVGRQLQLTLVELIALSLAGKQVQWTSYGREFVGVHRHLDHVVEEWRELGDVVAGRAAAIGIPARRHRGSSPRAWQLATLRTRLHRDRTAIERLCAQLWEVALRVRQRGELLADLDSVSQDV